MPYATLLEARSLHHDGVKYEKGKPQQVTDKVASALEAELPGYFTITYDAPAAPAGGIRINGRKPSQAKAAALAKMNKTSGEKTSEELDTGDPGRVVTV